MPPSILLPLRLPLPCPHTHLPWLLPLPYFDLILSQSLRLDEGLWEVSMPCPPFLLQTQAASQTGEHFKNQTPWATWFRVCPPSRSIKNSSALDKISLNDWLSLDVSRFPRGICLPCDLVQPYNTTQLKIRRDCYPLSAIHYNV